MILQIGNTHWKSGMSFNRDKCKLLYFGRSKDLHKYSAEKDQLDHSSAEKDWAG